MIVPDVAAVSPVDANLNVCAPDPAMLRFVNDAKPPELVVAFTVPPSVPVPLATEVVTVVPLWLTELPHAS